MGGPFRFLAAAKAAKKRRTARHVAKAMKYTRAAKKATIRAALAKKAAGAHYRAALLGS